MDGGVRAVAAHLEETGGGSALAVEFNGVVEIVALGLDLVFGGAAVLDLLGEAASVA